MSDKVISDFSKPGEASINPPSLVSSSSGSNISAFARCLPSRASDFPTTSTHDSPGFFSFLPRHSPFPPIPLLQTPFNRVSSPFIPNSEAIITCTVGLVSIPSPETAPAASPPSELKLTFHEPALRNHHHTLPLPPVQNQPQSKWSPTPLSTTPPSRTTSASSH